MSFWDASALVPLLLHEPATESARGWLRRDPGLVVWWGTPVECLSAIARRMRDGHLAATDLMRSRAELSQLAQCWYEVLPTERVREHAQRLLLRHPLRTADAFQLAAALTWAEDRPNGHRLYCLDARLAVAALGEGFAVVPDPGPMNAER